MGKNYISLLILLLPVVLFSQNVGVNTSNPQQKLHLAGEDSNIRVDAFNSSNNINNTSATVTAPLYVDSEGVLNLNFEPFYTSDGDDFDGSLPSAFIYQEVGQVEEVEQILYTKVVYVPRPSYIHINYSISFSVSETPSDALITDGLSRLIKTFITVDGIVSTIDGLTREYGKVAQCYINEDSKGANQVLFNSASAYILLPEGTHTINFYGAVSSDSSGAKSTYVNFGLAQDMLLMRLY
ncbi:MAG TPA: hypothetical protein VFM70_01915 [Salinimicrobium sp.]|nr:hypothetical protein [Salinimicrobium sp.]